MTAEGNRSFAGSVSTPSHSPRRPRSARGRCALPAVRPGRLDDPHVAAGRGGPVADPDDIFQLPAGYRPAQLIEVATVSRGQFGRVQIDADGAVSAAAPSDCESLSLEGISFRCAPAGQNGCP